MLVLCTVQAEVHWEQDPRVSQPLKNRELYPSGSDSSIHSLPPLQQPVISASRVLRWKLLPPLPAALPAMSAPQ